MSSEFLSRFCDHYYLSYFALTRKACYAYYGVIYVGYWSEVFLGKFLKYFSGDQVVAWGLFGMDFVIWHF